MRRTAFTLCVVLMTSFMPFYVFSQITDTGSISWVNFDNITITSQPTRTFALWKMPKKPNWTGILGLTTETGDDYLSEVSFTYGVDQLPPSFDPQNSQVAQWNEIIAMGSIQLPAQYGDGSDEWYLLFSGIADQTWIEPVNISFYIIEMQTLKENETSSPITLYSGQEFLFKVRSIGMELTEFQIEGDSMFEAGDVVQLHLSRSCQMDSALAVGHIPSINDNLHVSQYVYLSQNGSDIFYLLQLSEDCSSLTVRLERLPPAVVVNAGDVIYLTNWTWTSLMLLTTSQQYTGLQIQMGGLPLIQGYVSMFASTNNFQTDDQSFTFQNAPDPFNQSSWIVYTSSLEPLNWYFIISGSPPLQNPITVSFSIPDDSIQLGENNTVVRDMSLGSCTDQTEDSQVTYRISEPVDCVCLQTNWNNMQISSAYPQPPPDGAIAGTIYYPSLAVNTTDPYLSQVCFVKPPSFTGDILVTLGIVFDTLDSYQNNLFYGIPTQTVSSGAWNTLPNGQVAFYHYMNTSAEDGGLAILSRAGDCSKLQLLFTSDDWTLPWITAPTINPTLLSSNTVGHGWFLLAVLNSDAECQLSVTSIDATYVTVSPTDDQVSFGGTLSFTPFDSTSSVGLIHIHSTTDALVLVEASFSSMLQSATGQAGTIPPVGYLQSFSLAPDYMLRVASTQYNTTSLLVPAVAFKTGAASTDFFVVMFTDLNDTQQNVSIFLPPEITIPFESPSTVITIPSSHQAQLYRIPYDKEILVAVTEVGSSAFPESTLTNTTLFGAGGLQTIGLSYASNYPGLHTSPLQDYFYASNYTNDYYLLVMPNSLAIEFSIQGNPVRYLCDPVLLCNGQGTCHEDRLEEDCICVQGFGYGYDGDTCDSSTNDFIWFTTVLSITILAALGIAKAGSLLAAKWSRERKSREKNSLSKPLLEMEGEYGSESLVAHLAKADVALDNVSLIVGSARLLTDISVQMKAGELTAIFGPSGAGKSTVMKVLSGRYTPTKGDIIINGTRTTDMTVYRTLIGYVPQEDVMNPLMTVQENIMHSARMRLPASLSFAEKSRLVTEVIKALGLSEKQDVIVGDLGGRSSLSGGQRKRVSIGMELVMCPSILFLDEPTSGLDSKSALSLITLLKNQVASLGISVVAVLHQPRYEILCACDKIMLLADGRLKYFGSPTLQELSKVHPRLKPNQSGEYAFHGSNVADLLIDYINEFTWVSPQHEKPANNVSDNHINSPCEPLQPRQIPPFWVQFMLLLKRAMVQLTRDAQSLLTLYGLTILSALLIGSLYHDSEFVGPPSAEMIAKCPSSFQFLCAQNQQDTYMVQALLINLAMGLTAGAASLSTFGGSEKLLFLRERFTGQSNFAYVVAKLVSTLPNELFAPLLFMSIYQWLTTPQVDFWKIYIVAVGVCDVCMNFSHVMSIILEDNRALIVSVVGICINNILSGFNPTLHQLKNSLGFLGPTLASLSYSRWCMEAFYLAIVGVYNGIYDLSICLTAWDYKLSEFHFALCMPFVLGFVLRVIAVGSIVYKGRK